MNYWLLKSEPSVFSLDDLRKAPGGRDHWDGVRNYQARNYLCAMAEGDQAFFYHSNCVRPGIVGIVEICRAAYPDHTAFDPHSPYHDPRSTHANPRWYMVDVRFLGALARPVPLSELKQHPELAELPLVQRGCRLSVMPVTAAQWQFILALAERNNP